MSPRARRRLRTFLVVAILGGGGGVFVAVRGGKAPQAGLPLADPLQAVQPPADPPAAPPQVPPPEPPDGQNETLKRFQWGVQLGKERAGFSGLPMIQVFVDAADDQAAVTACLESPEIASLMPHYTGVLIALEDETASPRRLRRSSDVQVIVRRVNGKVLGVLERGFTCAELEELLATSVRRMIIKPKKSPVYRRLLESPAPVDRLIERGKPERARKYVDFLRELEGEGHPAVIAAEQRLAARR